MNPFIIPSVVDTASSNNVRHFPLGRATKLRQRFSELFSRHLGGMSSGHRFEAEILVVTGRSGAGKTLEISQMLKEFHEHTATLSNGKDARFVHCILDRKGGWKDLGRKTLMAMGYPLSGKARLTQSEIWERVAYQAKAQGIIGIHYDEAQHIFAGKSDNDRETILDSFKTLLKPHDWPLMLILSGVPELAPHVRSLDQVYSKVSYLHFDDIDLPDDYEVIHEVVGSYAMENGLEIAEELLTSDFYHRLATAAALRWGLLISITINAVGEAIGSESTALTEQHFIEYWMAKTGMNELVTPFTHDGYATMFRPDKPFQAMIGT